MATNAQQAYLEGEILQADPVQLVRILYRAALDHIGKARQAVRLGDVAQRNKHVCQTAAILYELALALDREKGNEIAGNLAELYDYVQWLLQEANFRQTEPPMEEAARLLTTLLEAWEGCQAGVPAFQSLPLAGQSAAYPKAGFTC